MYLIPTRPVAVLLAFLASSFPSGAAWARSGHPSFVFGCDGTVREVTAHDGRPRPVVDLVAAGMAPAVRDGCSVEDLGYDPSSGKVVVVVPREPDVGPDGRRHYDLLFADPSDLTSYRRVRLVDAFLGSPVLVGPAPSGTGGLVLRFRTGYGDTRDVVVDDRIEDGFSLTDRR